MKKLFENNWEVKSNILLILLMLELIIILMVFGYFIGQDSVDCRIEQQTEQIILEGNSLMARSSTYYPKYQVLGTLVEKIVACESSGNPKAKNPKSTAYGLCQFIDGTWDYVQEKWNMTLDRHDPEDQLYACKRLLEEEGLSHWKPVWKCIDYDG